MEFSLILVPAVRAGEPEPFDTLIEQIEFAEELGYDAVWFTEHHFSQYGRAAVPVLAAQAIERTSRLRISTAVVVLPFQHPVPSRGRLGHARSHLRRPGRCGDRARHQPAEFKGFDVPMDEAEQRFSEALDIIRRAWTEESFLLRRQVLALPRDRGAAQALHQAASAALQAALSDYTVQKVIDRGINGLIGPYLCPYETAQDELFRRVAPTLGAIRPDRPAYDAQRIRLRGRKRCTGEG